MGVRVTDLRLGDCVEVLRGLEAASVDAIVCDPPYGLEFMGKDWDRLGASSTHRVDRADELGEENKRRYIASGVTYGQDTRAMQAWHEAWAREAFRVLKPGGHLLAFGGTRTYHRLACAVEDAGFEIRDTICWLYGSGFPKSLDVSKAIDKAAGEEREVVGRRDRYRDGVERQNLGATGNDFLGLPNGVADVTAPATDDARRWQGWGTALKPAHEPIVVARKPLAGTVAANVLAHGVGALNVDGCRIGREEGDRTDYGLEDGAAAGIGYHGLDGRTPYDGSAGRWPANVVLDETAAAMLDEQTGELPAGVAGRRSAGVGMFDMGGHEPWGGYADSGGASRFFYVTDKEAEHAEAARLQSGGRSDVAGADGGGADVPGLREVDGAAEEVRFRYVAKASRAERNAGLDGFEAKAAGVTGMRAPEEGEKEVYEYPPPAGIGEWLRAQRYQAGLSVRDVAVHFPSATGGVTGCVWNWENEANRPTIAQWWRLKELLGFDDTHDEAMTTLALVPREASTLEGGPRARAQNHHPTVKPVQLMRWLVRLVTPPGGTVLDPFLGSGTTGIAAALEGLRFIGIERDPDYLNIARARIRFWEEHGEDGLRIVAEREAAEAARAVIAESGQLDILGLLAEGTV